MTTSPTPIEQLPAVTLVRIGEAERLEGLAGVLVQLAQAQVNPAAAWIYAQQASEYQRRATALRQVASKARGNPEGSKP